MRLGVFFQSSNKIAACYKAMEQFRIIYPDVPVSLYEGGHCNVLKPVAKKFNLDYKIADLTGHTSKYCGGPTVDVDSNIKWLGYIHEACTTILQDTDWIINYEEDVWCKRRIQYEPKLDIEGANGPMYTPELYQFLKDKFNITNNSRDYWSANGSLQGYGACGGTIFNRDAFLLAFSKLSDVPWDTITKLDIRPTKHNDACLSFIMQHAGCTSGIWKDWGSWRPGDNDGHWWDKTGWTTTMSAQPDVAFLHEYKHFYNYTAEDLNIT